MSNYSRLTAPLVVTGSTQLIVLGMRDLEYNIAQLAILHNRCNVHRRELPGAELFEATELRKAHETTLNSPDTPSLGKYEIPYDAAKCTLAEVHAEKQLGSKLGIEPRW